MVLGKCVLLSVIHICCQQEGRPWQGGTGAAPEHYFHRLPHPVSFLVSGPSSEGSELPALSCRSQAGPWSCFSESTLQVLFFLGQCMQKLGMRSFTEAELQKLAGQKQALSNNMTGNPGPSQSRVRCRVSYSGS